MAVKRLDLAWIVVQDIKKSIKFYTEILGMELKTYEEQYGWAELVGLEGGARLGITQKNDHESIQPGQNAVVTFTVDNLEKAVTEMTKKGMRTLGEIMEVPGAVKLQMVVDLDNNHLQIVEILNNHAI